MKKHITTILFAGIAASQLGSTDCGNVLADPGFDVWCGDTLCDWKIERGNVQRVPTWNAGDPGVSLVGTDVAIEQVAPVADTDGSCIEFDVIANIDPNTQVALNIDVFGDGSIERTEMLPSAPWQALAYRSQITGVFRGIRFEITKQGSGNAVLAQIGARIVDDCGDDPYTIVPAAAPLGAPCSDDNGCASAMCEMTLLGQMCVACSEGTCSSGETCGLGDPVSPVRDLPRQCVPDAMRELGEQCLGDAECASGICNLAFGQPTTLAPGGTYGECSTCDPQAHPCADGAQCGPAWNVPNAPFVCAPAGHLRMHGEPCASDDDCASSACSGTSRSQCDDGRECATSSDCPFGGSDTLNGLQNGPCTIVGVQGGSCQ